MLERQLAMNVQTWDALKKHGVTEATDLRLDFTYDAPSRAAADKLVKLLRDETDYDVAEPQSSDKGFVVTGTTQVTQLSLAILNQWVEGMACRGPPKRRV